MFTKRVFLLVCLMLGLLVVSPTAQNPIAIQDLGSLGGHYASATGANIYGQIVGSATTGAEDEYGGYIYHAFLYTAGMVDLGTLADPSLADQYGSAASAINDMGQVVGYSDYVTDPHQPGNHSNYYHAFLYTPATTTEPATMVDLTPDLNGVSQAMGINSLGQVVGWAAVDGEAAQGFLYDSRDDTMTPLPTLWKAQAINDYGQIVGESATTFRAALYDCGTGSTTELGALGSRQGLHSTPYGINNNGWVVGQSETDVDDPTHGDPVRHAFLYADEAMRDLGSLDGPGVTDRQSGAYGINDSGQIVGDSHFQVVDGSGSIVSSGNHAFVYTVAGGMKDLGTIVNTNGTGPGSSANAINGAGQVVGYSDLPDNPDESSAGTHAVSWTNVDQTPPVVAVPANIAVDAAAGQAGAVVTFAASATDDVDVVPPVVTCTPPSGSMFPVGPTTVTCTATDLSGNTGSAAFIVTVTGGDVTTPGEMRGDGFVVKAGDRYHFTFDVSEGQRHAARDRFRLRIDYDSRMGVDSKGKPKWTKPADDDFVATAITSIAFSDDPTFRPGHGRKPQVDTVQFSGTGKWNGRAGYAFDVLATDQGEPGRHRETVAITITRLSDNKVVASVAGTLAGGNIQSVRLKH